MWLCFGFDVKFYVVFVVVLKFVWMVVSVVCGEVVCISLVWFGVLFVLVY